MAEILTIREAVGAEDLATAAALCNGFRDWIRARYADRAWLVDAYYPDDEWAAMIDGLPVIHAPPAGAILLADLGGRPVGCVMLKPDEPGICEMKRLFVLPEGQGRGVGRALCARLIGLAAGRGYRTMRLETGVLQSEAVRLYESLGFVHRDVYHPMSDEMAAQVIAMERPLAISDGSMSPVSRP